MYQTPHGSADDARRRYAADRLETASNAQILVLCFDRLDRDLARARTSIEAEDHDATNDLLGHAQELVGELALMLDTDAWEHAGSLLSIYDYVLRLLAVGNATKSDARVAEAQRLVGEIGSAFRVAATSPAPGAVPAAAATAARGAFGGDDPSTIRVSVQA